MTWYLDACKEGLPRWAHVKWVDHLQVKLHQGDLAWQDFVSKGAPRVASFQPHVAAAEDRINILFSSGTTGTLPHRVCWVALAASSHKSAAKPSSSLTLAGQLRCTGTPREES